MLSAFAMGCKKAQTDKSDARAANKEAQEIQEGQAAPLTGVCSQRL